MQPIETMFSEFADDHQTFGNRTCHLIGIPLIVLSALGLLAKVRFGAAGEVPLDLGIAVVVVSSVYYVLLEWRLAVPITLAALMLYLGSMPLPAWFLVLLFVMGGALEFIGHKVFEKRRPAFSRNAFHLLIGPIWILNQLIPVVHDPTLRKNSLN